MKASVICTDFSKACFIVRNSCFKKKGWRTLWSPAVLDSDLNKNICFLFFNLLPPPSFCKNFNWSYIIAAPIDVSKDKNWATLWYNSTGKLPRCSEVREEEMSVDLNIVCVQADLQLFLLPSVTENTWTCFQKCTSLKHYVSTNFSKWFCANWTGDCVSITFFPQSLPHWSQAV